MNIFTLPYPHNWTYQLNFQKGPFVDFPAGYVSGR